jgi:cbb3-type cytochrome oxidase maturation protein
MKDILVWLIGITVLLGLMGAAAAIGAALSGGHDDLEREWRDYDDESRCN